MINKTKTKNKIVFFKYSVGRNRAIKGIEAASEDLEMNDDSVYELPDSENITEQNQPQSKPEMFAVQESSTYTSLKENEEPEHVYQSLQTPQLSDIIPWNSLFTWTLGTMWGFLVLLV